LKAFGKIFKPKSYTGGNTAEFIRGGKDFFRKLIEIILKWIDPAS